MQACFKSIAVVMLACLASAPASAQSADEKSDYEMVLRIGSRRAYETFLETHPTGYYANRIKGLLDSLPESAQIRADFELVDKIGTRKAYEVFLETHKTGYYADLARKKMDGPHGVTKPNFGDDVFIRKLMPKDR